VIHLRNIDWFLWAQKHRALPEAIQRRDDCTRIDFANYLLNGVEFKGGKRVFVADMLQTPGSIKEEVNCRIE